ncbi:MAG: M23 family metallopeptidase [Acidobacteria bacterium]|nr:MAG: M23 family metallopeptidase [Acidobacteriota bacterium]
MTVLLRCLLLGMLAVVYAIPCPALAARKPGAPITITAAPGTLVRWTAPGITRCGMQGRTWAPLLETCYYPIDLLQKPGVIAISGVISGRKKLAHISVEPFSYGTEEIELPDIPQANPSKEDLNRDRRDQTLVSKVFARREGPAKFTLPIGPPVRPLPEGKAFGAKRVFNGKPAPQPHTGSDYAAPAGSPVLVAADGTVLIAKDLFFAGNAVFIDHGNGLVTMYFHLSRIEVEVGQEVTKGHTLGVVGSTGRSTGPHLFFGVRWHNARIDPLFLLEDPGKIPSVSDASAPAAPAGANANDSSRQTRKR